MNLRVGLQATASPDLGPVAICTISFSGLRSFLCTEQLCSLKGVYDLDRTQTVNR